MSKVILVVEDEPTLAEMYRTKLEHEGYKVLKATDGEEALQKALPSRPNLILLDLMMPVMNGIEVINRLKAHNDTRDIPVMVITNHGDEIRVRDCLKMGAIACLVKADYDPSEVVAKVNAELKS